jgi:prepilin-type N-terminal cleavage/methylation domain-containing protein
MPTSGHTHPSTAQSGFTLVEMLIATTLAGLLIAGLSGVIGQALTIHDAVSENNDLTQQARFAMNQMVTAVSKSRRLMLPMPNKTTTLFVENIREQTIPASTPPPGSSFGNAVLAVTLPAYFDLDGNGIPDADNDGDGRLDEDLPADTTNDGKPGIVGIDDDGNGVTDYSFSPVADDDESNDFAQNEDNLNGVDDDGDGITDEDPGADNNADGCAGICGVDDNADGSIDAGAVADDDEDGSSDEDWYDPVVFYLSGSSLMQRTPVPWDVNSSGTVTGLDFIEDVIAENVTRLRVERVSQPGRKQIVDLTLELTSPDSGESVSLRTRVRVGGAL